MVNEVYVSVSIAFKAFTLPVLSFLVKIEVYVNLDVTARADGALPRSASDALECPTRWYRRSSRAPSKLSP
jgi:hypothetical protein